jgi:hypothetical protein
LESKTGTCIFLGVRLEHVFFWFIELSTRTKCYKLAEDSKLYFDIFMLKVNVSLLGVKFWKLIKKVKWTLLRSFKRISDIFLAI